MSSAMTVLCHPPPWKVFPHLIPPSASVILPGTTLVFHAEGLVDTVNGFN